MLVKAANQRFTEQETEGVPVNLFCLSCGSLRLDWIETGWRCQECGVVEEISMAEPTFSEEQITTARALLDCAYEHLRALSLGQATDLLLDNLFWLPGVHEAKCLLLEAMGK